jgi:hypothetical protein
MSRDSALRRADILPASLAPIGLSREVSAAYVCVGTTLFDEMVDDGRMPPPRLINGRTIWDQEEVYAAFKALPHRGETIGKTKSDWSKVA